MAGKRSEETAAANGRNHAQAQTTTVRWDDADITNSYKRLSTLLYNVLQQYEARVGAMNVGMTRQAEARPSES